jgi:hypothetical protein
MPTYATRAFVEAYPVAVPAGAPGDALVLRAEREVDSILGPWPPDPTTGLKVDPSRLYQWQRDALSRAVAAQAEYLVAVGPASMVAPTPAVKSIAGPDFTETYADTGSGSSSSSGPILGPRVIAELAPIAELFRARGVRGRP